VPGINNMERQKRYKQTEEHIKERVESTKRFWIGKNKPKPPSRKGCIPWNKGLTKETDLRLKKISESGHMKNPEVRKNLSISRKGMKFSKAHCDNISKSKRGEKSYSWKGGVTPINKLLRTSRKYLDWKKKVFERDNYTCQSCGRKSGDGKRVILNAHHLIPISFDVSQIFNVDNGLTVCYECHREIHFGKELNKDKVRVWS